MGERQRLRIGLTGGIAAGKSTVAAEFVRLGAEVIDADEVYAWCVRAGGEGIAALVAEFGAGIQHPDGSLNRQALAKLVFEDQQARAKLNELTHPMVRAESARRIAASDKPVIVEDIPLLTETGQHERFDLVVVVEADPQVRLRRMIEHRDMSEDDALARISAQATDEQRRAIADVILHNHGDRDELVAQVDAFWAAQVVPWLRARDITPTRK